MCIEIYLKREREQHGNVMIENSSYWDDKDTKLQIEQIILK